MAQDKLPNLACSAARVNLAAWVYQICLFHCLFYPNLSDHFLLCLPPQYPAISPTCATVLFCGLLHRLLLVVCLSIFLLLFDVCLFYILCVVVFFIHCLTSCISLYLFSFVLGVSHLYIFSAFVFLSSSCIVNKVGFSSWRLLSRWKNVTLKSLVAKCEKHHWRTDDTVQASPIVISFSRGSQQKCWLVLGRVAIP